MPRPTTKSVFWHGLRDGAPFILVLVPFSMLFGVVATEAGLNVFETLTFSVMVLAGAAQFTALQLLAEDAPTFIALISALAVNLRMAMYSAALTPYLGAAPLWQRAIAAYFVVDQTYACSVVEYEKTHRLGHARTSWPTSLASPPRWCRSGMAARWRAHGWAPPSPTALALDFAIPITFLAIITPMLRTPAHVAAAIVAVVMSLIFAFLPYSLGVLVAGFAGMITGAQVEVMLERRQT